MGTLLAFLLGIIFGVIGHILYLKRTIKQVTSTAITGAGSDGKITKQKQ
jgi:hypothetical protein